MSELKIICLSDIEIAENKNKPRQCDFCEYYGNKYQNYAKKKTCINPSSPYNGCKRISNGTCKEFMPRSDGRERGFSVAWHNAHKEE